MADTPTWFVSLDTSIPPEKTIQLGQIIINPRDATSRLAPPFLPRPLEFSGPGESKKFRLNKSIDVTGKVMGHFLNIATFGLSAVFKKQQIHEYKIDKCTTYQFEPTTEYVNEAMKDPHLTSYIRRRKDMYMIVGLQVADSAVVYHLLGNTKAGGAKGGAPIAATGFEIDAHLDATKKTQMSQKSQIENPFVFAYRIKVCVRKNNVYGLRPGLKLPSHSAPRLYDTDDPVSIQKASLDENPQFQLPRIDANEDLIEGQYHISELTDDGKPTERMIILQESPSKWLYYAPAIGILVYAWLIYYLVQKVT